MHNFGCHMIGRILLKWNSSHVDFKSIITTPHLIHGKLILQGFNLITIIYIYSFNDSLNRISLWNLLKRIAPSIASPWFIMGDFNSIIHSFKKSGSVLTLNYTFHDFWDYVIVYGLNDLLSTSLYYTWLN